MQPLPTVTRFLTWLCVYPLDDTSNNGAKLACIGFSSFIFGIIFCQLPASVAFAIKFQSIDLELFLYAIYQVIAWSPMVYMFIIALSFRHKITAIIIGLSKIYDKGAYNLHASFQRNWKNIFNKMEIC